MSIEPENNRHSVIWDFPLQVKSEGELIMAPEGTRWLKVVVKGDVPHLYGLVAPECDLMPYIFVTLCAGQKVWTDSAYGEHLPVDRELEHIDSFSIGDWFVGHTFLQHEGVTVDERYEDDFKEVGER